MTDMHGQNRSMVSMPLVKWPIRAYGANRLASNSLLECLVFARAASHDIESQLYKIQMRDKFRMG